MKSRIAVLFVTLALTASCTTNGSSSDSGSPARSTTTTVVESVSDNADSETAGLVPTEDWQARQDDYLSFASGLDLDPGNPLSLMAHAEAANRANRQVDLSTATPASFSTIFEKLDAFQDTGDFDLNRFLFLYLRYRDQLDPGLVDAIKERLLAFKYWWTEPTPAGVTDDQYYWTENHQIIFLANEYVAGQTFADKQFSNADMSGRDHVEHAKERLRKWFDWRARFGFSEWLSNVYWNEDLKGTLLLAEFAEDPEIARLAAMTLDVMMVELAGHVQRGTFGATHGRSYQKDKLNGRDEDTFSIAKLLFDQTPVPYEDADTATLLAIAEKYRPPEVALKIAGSKQPAAFRTKQGLPLDPSAPIDASVEPPYGLSFEGEDGLMVWWGMGGQFPWQVAPTSVAAIKQYDLFKTSNFQKAVALAPVVENADDETVRTLAAALAKEVNPGLLSQVDTYTWRSPGVMLSTALDWRPGSRGDQDHIWQATFDPDALVFTTHPRDDVPSASDPNANEGYWTGDGAMPRSAQYRNVNISIYSPQYSGGDGVGTGAYSFKYGNFTHAFFPTQHFDEVVERAGWVIARKGDGYIALWSARPTKWREYSADEFTRGLTEHFDLLAEGGPDNVWITEVADASDYDSFEGFVEAISTSEPQVASAYACPVNANCITTSNGGASVNFASPSQGELRFGWNPLGENPLPPLLVESEKFDLHPPDSRWDAPYAKSTFNSGRYTAELEGASLDLDFNQLTRITKR